MAAMMQCSGCKWWGAARADESRAEWDRRLAKLTNAKSCENPGMKLTDGADYETIGDSDFAIDGDHARLLTGPDFGCTQWEASDELLTTMMDLDGVG